MLSDFHPGRETGNRQSGENQNPVFYVPLKMNYPAASHEVSTGKIRSKGEASFGALNPPMGD
jgi:hypothetical protein